MKKKRIYAAIDLKSFYASVECNERNLNPLTTNLVVADNSRTEKTICLAVTPPLKKYGLSGRSRLFEVVSKVKEINNNRLKQGRLRSFTHSSYDETEISMNNNVEISYIVAPPRMALYMEYSARIYEVYLKYFAPEDIHVYSIDEVFIDITDYMNTYKLKPRDLIKTVILDIYSTTNITATAGIGTNLYLCKIAMDIVAKHIKPDKNGVRIAQLDEMRYRKYLWNHKPITDFWRVGKGIARKLEQLGLHTMGDIALCSVGNFKQYHNEQLLYDTFGVNAELLIDHAWGYESCTMADIKAYKPSNNSVGTGQVLTCPYDYKKTRLIIKEMLDLLVLDLVNKRLLTNQIVITIGYDIENVSKEYQGEITTDYYGRNIPKHAHATINLPGYTSSYKIIVEKTLATYDQIINENLSVRRVNMSANHIKEESNHKNELHEQISLFDDNEKTLTQNISNELEKERSLQLASIKIKQKYGKNALLKGMNLEDGANTIVRNKSIGGHKA